MGNGYQMLGGNVDSVANQKSVHHVRIDHGAAEHVEKSVESSASMHNKQKKFTMDSGANGNITPWTGRSSSHHHMHQHHHLHLQIRVHYC